MLDGLSIMWDMMQEQVEQIENRLLKIEQKPASADFIITQEADLPSAGVQGRTRFSTDGLTDFANYAMPIYDNGTAWKPFLHWEPMQCAVASLPTSPQNGSIRWATDALKAGQTTGNGTGCLVYYDQASATWRNVRNDGSVAT